MKLGHIFLLHSSPPLLFPSTPLYPSSTPFPSLLFLPSLFHSPSLPLPHNPARGLTQRCKLPQQGPEANAIIFVRFDPEITSGGNEFSSLSLVLMIYFLKAFKDSLKHPILAWHVLGIAQRPLSHAKLLPAGGGMGQVPLTDRIEGHGQIAPWIRHCAIQNTYKSLLFRASFRDDRTQLCYWQPTTSVWHLYNLYGVHSTFAMASI